MSCSGCKKNSDDIAKRIQQEIEKRQKIKALSIQQEKKALTPKQLRIEQRKKRIEQRNRRIARRNARKNT